jgi:Transposase
MAMNTRYRLEARARRSINKISPSRRISEVGVSEVTYYRWRNRFGGLEEGQAERLMEIETEIALLRRVCQI